MTTTASTSARRCCGIEQTETVERYLKALFHLGVGRGAAGTTEVARSLGVSPPSVTAMLHRLREAGLVEQAGWGRARLSDHGYDHARGVTRRHRLLETFLHDVLGVTWDAVHSEAERLEHGLSPRVEDLIDAALGHPRQDPHGDPIPARTGEHDEGCELPLVPRGPGDRFRVLRVHDRDAEALRVLGAMGIGIGAELEVLDEGADVGSWWVRHRGRALVLRPGVVGALRGEFLDGPATPARP